MSSAPPSPCSGYDACEAPRTLVPVGCDRGLAEGGLTLCSATQAQYWPDMHAFSSVTLDSVW